MDCEGIVTAVNLVYLFFILDNSIKIHMSILLTQRPSQKLPKIGSKVTIKNVHRFLTSYVVCKSSVLEGEFTFDYDKNPFFRLVNVHLLGFLDLFKVDEIVDLFDRNYSDLDENLKICLIQSTLQHLTELSNYLDSKQDRCLNEHICSFRLVTANSCKYVEVNTDKFTDFPHWSFGNHSSYKNTLLFGYYKIQPVYGLLMLTDSYHQIPCIISKGTPEKIRLIENTYVVIKKYKVITEVFQEQNVPNLEYLLIDFDEINVIYSEKVSSCCLFGTIMPSRQMYQHTFYFQLLRRSTVCIGESKQPECWLQILAKNTDHLKMNEVYLILPSNYIKIVSYFEEGQHYKLFHNEVLKETHNRELLRIKKLITYTLQEDLAFFLKDTGPDTKSQLLTVEECKQHVENKTELVSFEGVLKNKKFVNPLPSRTKRNTNIYGFGTPSSKVHVLIFSFNLNNKETYLDCYLNNWENTLMPLGLVPQMRVVVRNASPQSRKYLKSTPLTSLEIIAYEPLIHFETVNLYENHHLDWGRHFFLGHGNKLPLGALIWGTVYNIQILKIEVSSACESCSFVNENSGPCSHCKDTHRKFNFLAKITLTYLPMYMLTVYFPTELLVTETCYLTCCTFPLYPFMIDGVENKMHVSDEFGQSKVLAKYPEIMKVILDLQDHQFQVWLKVFKELSQYTYNLFEEQEETDPLPERCIFKQSLTEYLRVFNEYGMINLDLKCRKLNANLDRNKGRPLWFCIDARRSKK